MSNNTTRHCPNCGSVEIFADAAAKWDTASASWVIASVHDNCTCADCDAEFYTCDAVHKAA